MTQSLVELALPDGPVYRSELVDPFVSKIGGRPVSSVALNLLLTLYSAGRRDLILPDYLIFDAAFVRPVFSWFYRWIVLGLGQRIVLIE